MRYYLNYNNDEDFVRGLLILFYPFTNELEDIHEKDIDLLYKENKSSIQSVRDIFEKHKVMTDIIQTLYKESEKKDKDDDNDGEAEETYETLEEETTSTEDIEKFEKWAKEQAHKSINQNKTLTSLIQMQELRKLIINLNEEQRRIFDDFCERLIIDDENSFYLYIAGDAGTGKSYLLRLMIEIVKHIKMKSGDDLKKPPAIVMAPTANAAFIINGKTIESSLGILSRNDNSFQKANPARISNFTFLYEDVTVVFCDEISMVGSSKFSRIHFQLQDIKGSRDFMGGVSFVAVGDFHQLPPVLERYVYENNKLDGRPGIAPSLWDEHFQIFYLKEKIRSQNDVQFSEICDRVGNGTFNKNDEEYLKSRVQNTESENDNKKFKAGKISIIVTTNKRRQKINEAKLQFLLPNEKEYMSEAIDRATNIENAPAVPENIPLTKTGALETKLLLKKDASVVITSNFPKKYKEDGVVNGARGYIDSIQESKQDPHYVDVVWMVFQDENVGKLLRYDLRDLKRNHKPKNENAVPILRQKKSFALSNGEIKYQRSQFPITLAYAVTAYKCQGATLDEVIIDFGQDPGDKQVIQWGSFYVALTRVREGKHVFLKCFEKNFITFNRKVEEKIEFMKQFRKYQFKKRYVDDQIFEENTDVKIGYLNMRGFCEGDHAEYLNNDKKLLH